MEIPVEMARAIAKHPLVVRQPNQKAWACTTAGRKARRTKHYLEKHELRKFREAWIEGRDLRLAKGEVLHERERTCVIPGPLRKVVNLIDHMEEIYKDGKTPDYFEVIFQWGSALLDYLNAPVKDNRARIQITNGPCPICPEEANQSISHMKTHIDQGCHISIFQSHFECCSVEIKGCLNWNRHAIQAHKEVEILIPIHTCGQYECLVCCHMVKNRWSLSRHASARHTHERQWPASCSRCPNVSIDSFDKLVLHIHKMHDLALMPLCDRQFPRGYGCTLCGRKVDLRDGKGHFKGHRDVKWPLECQRCRSHLKNWDDWAQHVNDSHASHVPSQGLIYLQQEGCITEASVLRILTTAELERKKSAEEETSTKETSTDCMHDVDV